MKTLLDGTFQDVEEVERLRPALMFRLWLAAGYLYEHRGETLIPDAVFDRLSLILDERWDEFSDPHKHIIDRQALRASTVFYLRPEDYPPMARALASNLMLRWHGKTVSYELLAPGKWATMDRHEDGLNKVRDRLHDRSHGVPGDEGQLFLF